jgi:hypothetical protein
MKPFFEEKQRYSQWWLWMIIGSAALAVTGSFLYGFYVQFILGEPWGDNPMSDEALIANAFIAVTVMVFLVILLFSSVLEVVVDKASVSYRYYPLIRNWKRIERETIQDFYRKEYTILTGYGVRIDFHGNRALTVKGNTGIEIAILNGKKFLIGTQKPDEFLDALNKMKKGSED